MISESDMTQIINRVRSEFGASPPAWLTNQWQPYLGAGRGSNGVVPHLRMQDAAGTTSLNAFTNYSFEIVRADTANFYDATQPTRATIRNPGRYLVCCWFTFAVNNTATRSFRALINGATGVAESQITANFVNADALLDQSVFVVEVANNVPNAHMTVGSYLEFQHATSTAAGVATTCIVSITRIGNV